MAANWQLFLDFFNTKGKFHFALLLFGSPVYDGGKLL